MGGVKINYTYTFSIHIFLTIVDILNYRLTYLYNSYTFYRSKRIYDLKRTFLYRLDTQPPGEINMYNIFTNSKAKLFAAVVSFGLIFSGTALAGKPDKVRPGKPGNDNIVEIALAVNNMMGEFDYLLAAVGCLTDEGDNNPVVDLLTGSDKYTLFAPVDSAFEALQMALGIETPEPELTCAVDDLFGEGTLFTILAYHVTDGRRFSNSVFNVNNNKDIEMLAGGYITTTPDLHIMDNAPQVIGLVSPLFNINASNGVIHVIDTVMLPVNPADL
jgi:uncharacterized surface protein with fasciclin (FAS1) repeats